MKGDEINKQNEIVVDGFLLICTYDKVQRPYMNLYVYVLESYHILRGHPVPNVIQWHWGLRLLLIVRVPVQTVGL